MGAKGETGGTFALETTGVTVNGSTKTGTSSKTCAASSPLRSETLLSSTMIFTSANKWEKGAAHGPFAWTSTFLSTSRASL